MLNELNKKFLIDSTSLILMNNNVNISDIPFPAATIIYDIEPYYKFFGDELVELSIKDLHSLGVIHKIHS